MEDSLCQQGFSFSDLVWGVQCSPAPTTPLQDVIQPWLGYKFSFLSPIKNLISKHLRFLECLPMVP